MAETARIRAWLATTLKNDEELIALINKRVFHGYVPAGTQYPYVVFQMLSPGNDLMGLGATRIWANPLYLIKAVTKGNETSNIEPVVNRIDQLLHAKSGTVTNGVIWECVRERPFDLPEVLDGGTVFMNLGAEYRIKASQLA